MQKLVLVLSVLLFRRDSEVRQPSSIHSVFFESFTNFGLIKTLSGIDPCSLPLISARVRPETTNIRRLTPIWGAQIATPSSWVARAFAYQK